MTNHSRHYEVRARIIFLAKRKATGSPDELARKLNVNASTVYRYIKNLKKKKVPIEYSAAYQSYVLMR